MAKQKVTIDCDTWGRGRSGGALLNSGGKKCCLGFICEQVFGKHGDDLLGQIYYPSYMSWIDMPDWYVQRASRAAHYNDNLKYTDAERIERIKALFSDETDYDGTVYKCPIELEFVGCDEPKSEP